MLPDSQIHSSMIVSQEKYHSMMDIIHNALITHCPVAVMDAITLGVSYDALSSLYRQMFVRKLRSELRLFSNAVKHDVMKRIRNGESLLAISKEFQLGSYKFAMLYVHEVLGRDTQLSAVLYNPELIPDERIRSELLTMISMDPSSAPHVDLLKEVSGAQYEDLLTALLTSRRMCFETEVELRSKGKPKTPDILFLVPMAVALSEAEQRHSDQAYAVINWIDSKAMFADAITVEEQMEQFRAYNNRYGRGMVLYWHGFSEEVQAQAADDMVLFR